MWEGECHVMVEELQRRHSSSRQLLDTVGSLTIELILS